MKTALIITGQIRNARETYPSLKKHILDSLNPDVYISTWLPETASHVVRYDDQEGKILAEPVENELGVQEILDMFTPQNVCFENTETEFYQGAHERLLGFGRFPETLAENVFLQQYKIRSGWRLIPDPKQYDFIIRSRFDLGFEEFPDLSGLDPSKIYIPKGWDWRGGINDLLAWGGPDQMEIYCNLFSNFFEYCSEGCVIHPEVMITHHFNKKGIVPERIPLRYSLRGMDLYQA